MNSHRFLNSTAPFRPMNPWGRAMPKPVRPFQDEREAIYNIEVDVVDRDGRVLRTMSVFPKMVRKAAEDFLEVVNKAIIDGKERTWANPRLKRH